MKVIGKIRQILNDPSECDDGKVMYYQPRKITESNPCLRFLLMNLEMRMPYITT
jgi:hypothetical protein